MLTPTFVALFGRGDLNVLRVSLMVALSGSSCSCVALGGFSSAGLLFRTRDQSSGTLLPLSVLQLFYAVPRLWSQWRVDGLCFRVQPRRHYICADVSYLYTGSGGSTRRQLHSVSPSWRRWLQGDAGHGVPAVGYGTDSGTISLPFLNGLAHRCRAGELRHQGGVGCRRRPGVEFVKEGDVHAPHGALLCLDTLLPRFGRHVSVSSGGPALRPPILDSGGVVFGGGAPSFSSMLERAVGTVSLLDPGPALFVEKALQLQFLVSFHVSPSFRRFCG